MRRADAQRNDETWRNEIERNGAGMQKRRKARRMTSCRMVRAGYSPNGIRIDRVLLAGLGDGDRWMVGGLVSPGSTVRRLTSVRGFYYDILESCGVRRNEGRTLFPRESASCEKPRSVPLGSHDLRPPIFTPFVKTETRIYYAWKKNLTPRANWKERSL